MNRRLFTLSTLGAISCRKTKSTGPNSLVLVANRDGEAVAVVDLRAFAAIRHIHVNGNPTTITALPAQKVAVLTPASGTVHRVDLATLAVDGTRQVAGEATTMALAFDGGGLYVLAERWFIRLNAKTLAIEWQLGLPELGVSFDLSPETPHALVAGAGGRIILIDLWQRRIVWQHIVSQQGGPARFLKNGRIVLVGGRAEKRLFILDTGNGAPVVELPLTLGPERFCFKQDGGQLFVSGTGHDAVAVVYPFQTQVAGTILAGHAPGVMAASADPDLLFVANPASGAVTVMDIRTHRIRAVVPVGQRPGRIIITPDNNFALALNEVSGDIAVIRVDAMGGRRTKSAPLFTMIPVGSAPVDAVVVDVI